MFFYRWAKFIRNGTRPATADGMQLAIKYATPIIYVVQGGNIGVVKLEDGNRYPLVMRGQDELEAILPANGPDLEFRRVAIYDLSL